MMPVSGSAVNLHVLTPFPSRLLCSRNLEGSNPKRMLADHDPAVLSSNFQGVAVESFVGQTTLEPLVALATEVIAADCRLMASPGRLPANVVMFFNPVKEPPKTMWPLGAFAIVVTGASNPANGRLAHEPEASQ